MMEGDYKNNIFQIWRKNFKNKSKILWKFNSKMCCSDIFNNESKDTTAKTPITIKISEETTKNKNFQYSVLNHQKSKKRTIKKKIFTYWKSRNGDKIGSSYTTIKRVPTTIFKKNLKHLKSSNFYEQFQTQRAEQEEAIIKSNALLSSLRSGCWKSKDLILSFYFFFDY